MFSHMYISVIRINEKRVYEYDVTELMKIIWNGLERNKRGEKWCNYIKISEMKENRVIL